MNLNKDKYHFRSTSVPFLGEVISIHGVRPDQQKLKVLIEMPPKEKKRTLSKILEWQTYVNHSQN